MPRKIYDWNEIQAYHDQGHGFVECQRRFGFSHTAWIKAIKLEKLDAGNRDFRDRRRRYDWSEIQAYYDEGHTYRECVAKFGFYPQSWAKARKRGEIKPRGNGAPIELVTILLKSRDAIKRRLLKAGLLKNRCDECGISEWRGKPLSVHVDHINGVRDDHRLENLRMLCPNCHSQTETYGARNKARLRALQEGQGAV
jgi:hypothetical protein